MRIRTEWQAKLSKFAADKIQVPELNTQSCITYNNGQMEKSLDKIGTCIVYLGEPLINNSIDHAANILTSERGKNILVY